MSGTLTLNKFCIMLSFFSVNNGNYEKMGYQGMNICILIDGCQSVSLSVMGPFLLTPAEGRRDRHLGQ